MNVKAKGNFYKNEKDGRVWFNFSDGSKDVDGNWTNKSWTLRFKKDQEPKDGGKIEFEGFFTYYAKDENTMYTSIMVMDYKLLEQQAPSVEIQTDELPF